MKAQKQIALVAHDRKKAELVGWVEANAAVLAKHLLWSTGTTGARIREACPGLTLTALRSGPLGGDQQLGARIAEGGIDILIFFTDPLSPLPHDVDVKALTRLATLYNVACATNRATADFLIASPYFDTPYEAPTGGGDGEPGTWALLLPRGTAEAIRPAKPKGATMSITPAVKAILDKYESDNPGTKANLARILMQGRLAGTGKMIILPVDQGFEHGPGRSFSVNPPAYDPHYHYQLAIDAGLNAYAAPLGALEAGAGTFAGQIPTILKINSSNSWATRKDQAVTGGVDDALRLGCSAIGFTTYPGSEDNFELIEEIRELSAEAKAVGLATVIWAYPRGGDVSKEGELALDVTAYGAHMAALLGAHIIKVKLPSAHIEQKDAQKAYEGADWSAQADRVRHVVQSCFAGRRMVVFSGGATKGTDAVFQDARDIRDGGGNGSIIGRNAFQRGRDDALAMLDRLVRIYKGEE